MKLDRKIEINFEDMRRIEPADCWVQWWFYYFSDFDPSGSATTDLINRSNHSGYFINHQVQYEKILHSTRKMHFPVCG